LFSQITENKTKVWMVAIICDFLCHTRQSSRFLSKQAMGNVYPYVIYYTETGQTELMGFVFMPV
jgi:hypothetical protein